MKFPPKPTYTKGEIDRAGRDAAMFAPTSGRYRRAVKVINEWRVGHGYPMHTFNVTLRQKAFAIDKNAIVARRLKRLPTILDKIGPRNTTKMMLSRMQDIGGVRAIMSKIDQVYQLDELYTERGRFPHILKKRRDYIAEPKESGYRGIHLVYEFNNVQGRGINSHQYDGLCVEVQLRTQLQHAWATAVETIGLLKHENFKSSLGDARWLEFFQCMSSVIAQLEDQPVLNVHAELTTKELYMRTVELIDELDVVNIMAGWVTGVNLITDNGKGRHYNILTLNVQEKKVYVYGFNEDELSRANARLEQLEAEAILNGSPEPVLVAAGDLVSLKRAYPNYFLDIKSLLKIVQMVVRTVKEQV